MNHNFNLVIDNNHLFSFVHVEILSVVRSLEIKNLHTAVSESREVFRTMNNRLYVALQVVNFAQCTKSIVK